MIARFNDKVERALRQSLSEVPRVEADQIGAPLAALTEAERVQALFLSLLITCYVVVEACGGEWPDDGDLRQFAHGLATIGATAERLRLDAEEIYQYLSRTALGPEPLDDVIPDRARAERLSIIVAQRAIVGYSPKGANIWDYLDQVENAIEIAMALDPAVWRAAVVLSYLPKKPAD